MRRRLWMAPYYFIIYLNFFCFSTDPDKVNYFSLFLGNLFPHMGRSFLGKSIWFRRIHEVQKVDQRTAIRFEPDS